MSLGEYLIQASHKRIFDFDLRSFVDSNNKVTFHIHPSGKDGTTLDFIVTENQLKEINGGK